MLTANTIRVEIGEIPKKREQDVIYFKSFEEMQKVLNQNRVRLLKVIREKRPDSIYQLAALVKRDQGNVTKDINVLKKYGFIKIEKKKEGKRTKSSPTVESEAIEMIIKLGAGLYGVAKDSLVGVADEFSGEKLADNTAAFQKQVKSSLKPVKKELKKFIEAVMDDEQDS